MKEFELAVFVDSFMGKVLDTTCFSNRYKRRRLLRQQTKPEMPVKNVVEYGLVHEFSQCYGSIVNVVWQQLYATNWQRFGSLVVAIGYGMIELVYISLNVALLCHALIRQRNPDR